MDATVVFDMLVKTFGAAGVLMAGIGLLFRWLLPKYEARTQELIRAYEARLAEYKAQLDEAKKQIDEASKERREMTDKFLAAMASCIAESNQILQRLAEEVEGIKKILPVPSKRRSNGE